MRRWRSRKGYRFAPTKLFIINIIMNCVHKAGDGPFRAKCNLKHFWQKVIISLNLKIFKNLLYLFCHTDISSPDISSQDILSHRHFVTRTFRHSRHFVTRHFVTQTQTSLLDLHISERQISWKNLCKIWKTSKNITNINTRVRFVTAICPSHISGNKFLKFLFFDDIIKSSSI